MKSKRCYPLFSIPTIDRVISGGMGWQLFVLLLLIIFAFALLWGVGSFFGQDISLPGESASKPPLLWQIYCHFIDPGDQMYIDDANKWFVVFVSFLGSLLMTGLLISTFSNILERRIERYANGTIHYNLKNHIVIIGFDSMVPYLVRQLCANEKYNGSAILVATTEEIKNVRLELHTKLNDEEEKRLSFLYARRDSKEDLALMSISKAKEAFILGEKGEYDRDSLNMDCVSLIAEVCAEEKRKNLLVCNVLFEFQTTFSVFKLTDVNPKVREYVDFCPFNPYENWAQKVLVPFKSNERGITYPLLDREPIGEFSEKYVHLIIIGMTPMGIALAVEAAHLAHYPNYITKKIRTRITFVDQNAEQEMYFFRGQYKHLFELSHSYYRDMEKDSEFKENAFLSDDFAYLGDFIDTEWYFVQGKAESPAVQHLLEHWYTEENALVTLAVCFNYPPADVAFAFCLPDKLYERNIPVLVYQTASSSVIDMAAASVNTKQYRNLYPFGMVDDCYDVDHTYLDYAKRVNYIYDYYYTFSSYPDRLPSEEEVSEAWDTLKRTQPIKIWSNIYNANFIPSKLRSIGLDYRSLPASYQFSDHEIGLLAELEHNRWNVEELLIGFKPVTEEQKRRIEQDKLYKEECKANYQHVDIRPYRELGEDLTGRNASQYDRCISIWLPLIVNKK